MSGGFEGIHGLWIGSWLELNKRVMPQKKQEKQATLVADKGAIVIMTVGDST